MATPRAFRSFTCFSCRQRLLPEVQHRTFASNPRVAAAPNAFSSLGSLTPSNPRNRGRGQQENTASINDILNADTETLRNSTFADELAGGSRDQPHKLHIYATKHNTHLTFVQPSKPASQTASSGVSGTSASAKDQNKLVDVLLSISAGNIGFRKAGRGSYDAAYQLAAFALKQMKEKGMLRDMHSLQVVLRGFGAGREAVTKVILGSEGRFIRNRIVSVVDATRLKQGGPRSKKPRRLG
ncbi:Putative ribosomal protein S11 [Septoria linicola]|uniref:Ribosomal protein S11 n=1 Tax=Septoria linicola TaxID=215465 RepID=A0A9Q9AJE0_9PEZI|nr:putative ribosomal protein S11 [Septoria linicola]USW47248.1 Putative ribosomal protein S11 [Septoria linicola]